MKRWASVILVLVGLCVPATRSVAQISLNYTYDAATEKVTLQGNSDYTVRSDDPFNLKIEGLTGTAPCVAILTAQPLPKDDPTPDNLDWGTAQWLTGEEPSLRLSTAALNRNREFAIVSFLAASTEAETGSLIRTADGKAYVTVKPTETTQIDGLTSVERPPRRSDDTHTALLSSFANQYSATLGDGAYHIFLDPLGGKFEHREAGLPTPSAHALAGQKVVVHWLVYDEYFSDGQYDVAFTGKEYTPGLTIHGFQAVGELSPMAVSGLGAPEWQRWERQRGFAGDQYVEITPKWHGKPFGTSYQVEVRPQHWYAWRLGQFLSPLGSDKILLAPGPEEGSKVIAQRDSGRYKGSAAFLVINPWGERDFTHLPPNPLDRTHVVVGTELSDIGDTLLLGLAYEIAPGFDVIPWGLISGKVNRLAPGYSRGDSFDGEVATLQIERRETERFWGFAVSADFFNKMFKMGGK